MQGSAGAPTPLMAYVIMAVALILVIGFRLRNVGKERPLKVGRLWIIPVIYLVLVGATLALTPPARPVEWIACIVALAIGSALGWQRGRLTHIAVDPATQEVRMKQSMTAFLFIIVLIAMKSGMRSVVGTGDHALFHMSPQSLTDILLAFALGLLGVQRIEMYLRARRLLAEAQLH
jgi:CcdC protein